MCSANTVVILAAGDGSRLKSSLPKVFHKVGGLCLLDHVIHSAIGIKPREIIAVVKPEYFNYPLRFGADVVKAAQEKPQGSADAVKCAMSKMSSAEDGFVYVLYADIPLISSQTLSDWAKFADDTQSDIVVLAMDAAGTTGLGSLCLDESSGQNAIKSIVEARDIKSTDKTVPMCNVGLLIKNKVLHRLINSINPSEVTGEYYITKIVEEAHAAGYVCRYFEGDKQELFGVNTRADLAKIESIFQAMERDKHMSNGVTLVAPETVFFSFDTVLDRDVTVYPYVMFGENVHIGEGCEVGPFCVVEGASVGRAHVGPFSRLRPGSEICDGAKIGNFVEVKNSKISPKVKVNHLSYVGDSEIGENTNIGAGTITCNYDGAKKHKTVIGKNVFVGSNTALVAPVSVEDDAMIGAGSVITRNVNSGDLAIARGDQRVIRNGASRFKAKR